MADRMIDVADFQQVTRFEVIDAAGRSYVKYGVSDIKLSLQDSGKTLKIFLREGREEEIND